MLLFSLLLSQALAATPDAVFQPTPAVNTVYVALSHRDKSPSCDELDAMVDDPVAAYEQIIDHAQQPPWAPMRAASCLIENHGLAAQARIESWVITPELRGLALLTFNNIDKLPVEVAISLSQRAVTEGPFLRDAKRRLAKSQHLEIQKIANSVVLPELSHK